MKHKEKITNNAKGIITCFYNKDYYTFYQQDTYIQRKILRKKLCCGAGHVNNHKRKTRVVSKASDGLKNPIAFWSNSNKKKSTQVSKTRNTEKKIIKTHLLKAYFYKSWSTSQLQGLDTKQMNLWLGPQFPSSINFSFNKLFFRYAMVFPIKKVYHIPKIYFFHLNKFYLQENFYLDNFQYISKKNYTQKFLHVNQTHEIQRDTWDLTPYGWDDQINFSKHESFKQRPWFKLDKDNPKFSTVENWIENKTKKVHRQQNKKQFQKKTSWKKPKNLSWKFLNQQIIWKRINYLINTNFPLVIKTQSLNCASHMLSLYFLSQRAIELTQDALGETNLKKTYQHVSNNWEKDYLLSQLVFMNINRGYFLQGSNNNLFQREKLSLNSDIEYDLGKINSKKKKDFEENDLLEQRKKIFLGPWIQIPKDFMILVWPYLPTKILKNHSSQQEKNLCYNRCLRSYNYLIKEKFLNEIEKQKLYGFDTDVTSFTNLVTDDSYIKKHTYLFNNEKKNNYGYISIDMLLSNLVRLSFKNSIYFYTKNTSYHSSWKFLKTYLRFLYNNHRINIQPGKKHKSKHLLSQNKGTYGRNEIKKEDLLLKQNIQVENQVFGQAKEKSSYKLSTYPSKQTILNKDSRVIRLCLNYFTICQFKQTPLQIKKQVETEKQIVLGDSKVQDGDAIQVKTAKRLLVSHIMRHNKSLLMYYAPRASETRQGSLFSKKKKKNVQQLVMNKALDKNKLLFTMRSTTWNWLLYTWNNQEQDMIT